ncbi:hypothetical protein [Hymenobacter guriensis]|uniref:Uncharacterized protein n=1 Tax=Hymenobacter guriensis TaxID=2793065 RepID=A0ABS0L376_9BACT|nr:hypothetical protein [Hymenobacter guriensis]MBG8554590.1 hypothetical protein [Hymenobacter guriensis]
MTKKKKAKAGKKKKTLFTGAVKSIKKLSTTQKVVGGSALVALGLGYLAARRGSFTTAPDIDANTGETLSSTEGASI